MYGVHFCWEATSEHITLSLIMAVKDLKYFDFSGLKQFFICTSCHDDSCNKP